MEFRYKYFLWLWVIAHARFVERALAEQLSTFDFLNTIATARLNEYSTIDLSSYSLPNPLPPDSFDDLPALTVLNLTSCGISSVSRSLFTGISNVQTLILNDNPLLDIPYNTFWDMHKLTSLELESCHLIYIPYGLLWSQNDTLLSLSLRGNIIRAVLKDDYILSSLEYLLLGSNDIHTISPDAFQSLTSLRYLELHDNVISSMPMGIFDALPDLNNLTLHSNPLDCCFFDAWVSGLNLTHPIVVQSAMLNSDLFDCYIDGDFFNSTIIPFTRRNTFQRIEEEGDDDVLFERRDHEEEESCTPEAVMITRSADTVRRNEDIVFSVDIVLSANYSTVITSEYAEINVDINIYTDDDNYVLTLHASTVNSTSFTVDSGGYYGVVILHDFSLSILTPIIRFQSIHGAAHELIVISAPTFPAGEIISVEIVSLDSYGDIAISSMDLVTLTMVGIGTLNTSSLTLFRGEGSFELTSDTAGLLILNVTSEFSSDNELLIHVTENVGVNIAMISPAGKHSVDDGPVPITIQVQDEFGNFVSTTPNGTVDVVWSEFEAIVQPSSNIIISGGEATIFVSQTIATNNTLSIIYSSMAEWNISHASTVVVFTAGVTSTYFLEEGPNNNYHATNTSGGIDVLVYALDQFGNLVMNDSSTLGIVLDDDTAVLSPGQLVTLSGGMASFHVYSTLAGPLGITVAELFPNGHNTTLVVYFIPAAASAVTLTSSMSSVRVGDSVMVTVSVTDAFGNIAEFDHAYVRLIANGTVNPSAVTGSEDVSIVGGVGIAHVSSTLTQSVNIILEDPFDIGLDVDAILELTFTAGDVEALAIEAFQSSAVVGDQVQLIVYAIDIFGNMNNSFTGEFNLTIEAESPSKVNLPAYVTIFSGVAVLDVISYAEQDVLVGFNANLSDHDIVLSATTSVFFNHGSAAALDLFPIGPATAGIEFPVVVSVVDEFGNEVNDATVGLFNVSMETCDSVTTFIPGGGYSHVLLMTMTAGNWTLSLVKLSPTSIDFSVTANILVLPGDAFSVVFFGEEHEHTVDSFSLVVLHINDAFGNDINDFMEYLPTSNYSFTIIAASENDVVVPTSLYSYIVDGEAFINYSSSRAINASLSLIDVDNTGLIMTDTRSLLFVAGDTAKWALFMPDNILVTGTPTTITVALTDVYGNIVSDESTVGEAAILELNGNVLDLVILNNNGFASYDIIFTTAGTAHVSVQGLSLFSSDIAVAITAVINSGEAVNLVLSVSSDVIVAGESFTLFVSAQDAFGNLNASVSGGDITIISDDGSNIGAVALLNGEASLHISFRSPGIFMLSISEVSGLFGLAHDHVLTVTVVQGAASNIVLLGPSKPLSVQDLAIITVRAQDLYGNDAAFSTAAGQLTVISEDAVSVSNNGDAVLISGYTILSVMSQTAGDVTLHLLSQGVALNTDSTLTLTFTPGFSTAWVLIGPTTFSVDEIVSVTIMAIDSYGNHVEYPYTTEMELYATGAVVSPLVSVCNGIGFGYVSTMRPGPVVVIATEITLREIGRRRSLFAPASDLSMTSIAGAAIRVVIIPPGTGVTNEPLSITVEARDVFGNIDYSATAENLSLISVGDIDIVTESFIDIHSGIGVSVVSSATVGTGTLLLTGDSATPLLLSTPASGEVRFVQGTVPVRVGVIDAPTTGAIAGDTLTLRVAHLDSVDHISYDYGAAVTATVTAFSPSDEFSFQVFVPAFGVGEFQITVTASMTLTVHSGDFTSNFVTVITVFPSPLYTAGLVVEKGTGNLWLTSNQRVSSSHDGGTTWRTFNDTLVTHIIGVREDGSEIWAVNSKTISGVSQFYKSINGGILWFEVSGSYWESIKEMPDIVRPITVDEFDTLMCAPMNEITKVLSGVDREFSVTRYGVLMRSSRETSWTELARWY